MTAKAEKPGNLVTEEIDYGGERVSDRFLVEMLWQFLRPFWHKLLLVFVMLFGVTGLSLLLPYLIQRAIDGPITSHDVNGMVPYGIAYFIIVLVLFGLRFSHTYLLQTVGQNALVNLRQSLFEHILEQDMTFFNNTPVGQLVSRLSNDIDALTELLSTSIVMVASNMITLIGIVIVMVALNWRLAIIGLSVMPVMVVATVFFKGRIRRSSELFHQVIADYLAFLNEQFGGMTVVQLFGRQRVSKAEFDILNTEYKDINTEMRDAYTVYASFLQILTTLGFAFVLYGGGQGILAQWATLGMLVSFIEYTRRIFIPIQQLSDQFSQIQTALAAGERIARMMRAQSKIAEPQNAEPVNGFQGEISFEQVEFSYRPGTPVLRGVNLTIPARQRVAIVGATGAGKTSLAGLLARFYDVDSGHVRIDGIDVRDLSFADLRRFVTVVPQNPYCFNGTIADNLRLFDDSVTREQMVKAARVAAAAPFIEKLPDRYDYVLLPGGANLSQGQRQLLALARALIHNPDSILLLDEATSNIDTETEELIQTGLDRVMQNRTSLIIAHRLSTVRDADRILVMNRGQIVEDGTHDQLLALDGLYARLYHRQFAQVGMDEHTPSAEPQPRPQAAT